MPSPGQRHGSVSPLSAAACSNSSFFVTQTLTAPPRPDGDQHCRFCGRAGLCRRGSALPPACPDQARCGRCVWAARSVSWAQQSTGRHLCRRPCSCSLAVQCKAGKWRGGCHPGPCSRCPRACWATARWPCAPPCRRDTINTLFWDPAAHQWRDLILDPTPSPSGRGQLPLRPCSTAALPPCRLHSAPAFDPAPPHSCMGAGG